MSTKQDIHNVNIEPKFIPYSEWTATNLSIQLTPADVEVLVESPQTALTCVLKLPPLALAYHTYYIVKNVKANSGGTLALHDALGNALTTLEDLNDYAICFPIPSFGWNIVLKVIGD